MQLLSKAQVTHDFITSEVTTLRLNIMMLASRLGTNE